MTNVPTNPGLFRPYGAWGWRLAMPGSSRKPMARPFQSTTVATPFPGQLRPQGGRKCG